MRVEIIGHRGNPGNPLNTSCIENTQGSFQSSLDVGADGYELDAIPLLPEDGVLAVHHDDFLGRVFVNPLVSEKKPVSDLTIVEIQACVLNEKGLREELGKKGYQLTPNIHTAKIPTLDEIPLVKGKKYFLELKFINDKLPEDKTYLKEAARRIVDFIEKKGIIDNAYVLCFVGVALDEVKKLNPQIKTVYNVYQHETDGENSRSLIPELQRRYSFDIIHPPFEQVTEESIKICHDLGVVIYSWVWNQKDKEEIEIAKQLASYGIDGITTNQPDALLQLIKGSQGKA